MQSQDIRAIDLHMHTVVSDGTDTPEELLENVKKAGIKLFSVTDHDAVKGCRIIMNCRRDDDPVFITGVELSCRDEHGQYHILGYGYDCDARPMKELIETGHANRISKVAQRIDFLRREFGFEFPKEDIEALFALDNPGKPHIGNMMVRFGYAPTKDIAIKQYINKLHIRAHTFSPREAIEGILAGGGIPVLAHPSYGSGDQIVMGSDMDERLRMLCDIGLRGVEAFYSGFTSRLRGEMLSFAEKYGLFVTAGSDYHGRNKLIELGDTGLGEVSEYPAGLYGFLEAVGYSPAGAK